MRNLMFLLLFSCPSAFAIEQVFVASHSMKIERSRSATVYHLEAYDREGYKRLSIDKQVHFLGSGNAPVTYYSFGIKETMTEAWRFQEVTPEEYKLLVSHITTTPQPGFLRRFVKGCMAVVDISTNNRLYGASVNSCIKPAEENPVVAEKKNPAPPEVRPSEVSEKQDRYDEAFSGDLLKGDAIQVEAVRINGVVR